jgi:hypothetical protein
VHCIGRFLQDLKISETVGSLQSLLGFEDRAHWQSRDKAGLDDKRLFPVRQGSDEFEAIAGELLRTLTGATVDSIERVENGPQHELYSVHRRNLERDVAQSGKKVVHLLFHGTSEEAVQSIVHSDSAGFLPLLAGTTTGALWGDGTYFARDASYSDTYACRLSSGQKQVSSRAHFNVEISSAAVCLGSYSFGYVKALLPLPARCGVIADWPLTAAMRRCSWRRWLSGCGPRARRG